MFAKVQSKNASAKIMNCSVGVAVSNAIGEVLDVADFITDYNILYDFVSLSLPVK